MSTRSAPSPGFGGASVPTTTQFWPACHISFFPSSEAERRFATTPDAKTSAFEVQMSRRPSPSKSCANFR